MVGQAARLGAWTVFRKNKRVRKTLVRNEAYIYFYLAFGILLQASYTNYGYFISIDGRGLSHPVSPPQATTEAYQGALGYGGILGSSKH